ncbi:MAG: protein kinase [Pseudomonadota bacterium]
MAGERSFSRLEHLFNSALELPEEQRASYLDAECDGDFELKSKIERLLSQESKGTQLGVLGSISPIGIAETSVTEGQELGAYKIKRELGSGGMGTVYLASRADDEYEKDVAIKMVRDRLSRELIQRFRNERQILASMEHPNIARLLDGGTTEDDFPYVVMEYVDGCAITDYCDQHGLTIDQRLRLFLTVCGAVQYAHQNLVVHRDIKPQNILVTGNGIPKLLDFGIAKLLTQDQTGKTAGLTVSPRLTPEYASPEQVRGAAITTASDVYSLGVLLYELLTGNQPYSLAAHTPIEVHKVICEQQPYPASLAMRQTSSNDKVHQRARARGTTPGKLSNRLSGDLDNILLMALRKEQERRYATADALADDIQRYLKNEPVVARKDTWSYRVTKFIKRNSIGVIAASVVLMTVLTAAAISIHYAIMENRQRELAEQRFDDVRQLATTFLYDIHDSVANEGRTTTRDLLLSTGLEYLDALSAQENSDISLRADIARGRIRVAKIQGDVSQSSQGNAAEALDNAQAGMEIVQKLLQSDPDSTNLKLIAAEGYQVLGSLGRHVDTLEVSRENFEQALAMRRDVHESHPKLGMERPRLDEIHVAYAGAVESSGFYEEAIAHHQLAIDSLQQQINLTPENTQLAETILSSKMFVGQNHQRLGQFDKARTTLEGLLTEIQELRAGKPSNVGLIRTLAAAQVNLGRVYDALGLREQAEEELLEALRLHESLSAYDPGDLMMWHRVSISHHFLGRLYNNLGKHEQALGHFEKMLVHNKKIVDTAPDSLSFKRHYAVALDMNGGALRRVGRLLKALEHHQRANKVFRELAELRAGDIDARRSVAVSWYFLGQLQREIGTDQSTASPQEHLKSAIRAFETSKKIIQSLRDEGNLPPGDANNIAMLEDEANKTRELLRR